MSWALVAVAAGSVIGGALSAKSGRDQAKNAAQMQANEQQYNRDLWADQLAASRINQQTPFGSVTWGTDENGNIVQRTALDPADQARLGDLAAARMAAAKGTNIPTGNIDWDSLGMGKLARAAGVQPGGTTDELGYRRLHNLSDAQAYQHSDFGIAYPSSAPYVPPSIAGRGYPVPAPMVPTTPGQTLLPGYIDTPRSAVTPFTGKSPYAPSDGGAPNVSDPGSLFTRVGSPVSSGTGGVATPTNVSEPPISSMPNVEPNSSFGPNLDTPEGRATAANVLRRYGSARYQR
jgi:hypothetical protein